MITIRPSIFCFFGKLAPDLYGAVPVAVRRRLGAVPDVFAFVSVTAESIDLKLGTRRPKLPAFEGSLQNRLWQTLTYAAAAIGNIRMRTDALRRPPETPEGFQVVRGGPDIHLVECLSDVLGWEVVFAIAEKISARTDAPPAAGRARGIFPLFHLPSVDEDLEREQALEGLRRLEGLMRRGILFPSIVLDRVNRNGYPLERWEDLTELLSDFIALGSASEAAGDVWRTFPQVADLHGIEGAGAPDDGAPGLCSIGLSRFRFSREALGEELGRLYLRDLKRALSRTFSAEPIRPSAEECRGFLSSLSAREASVAADGMKAIEDSVTEWARALDPSGAPGLGVWACALDRLQRALFERLGEAAQEIENLRQENEALTLESPLRESWIARISVLLPPYLAYLPPVLGGALLGSFAGFLTRGISLEGYFTGGAIGAIAGLAAGWLIRTRWARETFTLGDFAESAFTEGFPVPRTLERHSRKKKRGRSGSGLSIQLWGELRSQVEPEERNRLDASKARITVELAAARREEAELIFLDRCINSLRERVEMWRERLGEVEIWEPGRGFSGDIFPADGPRKIYEWFGGRDAAEAAVSGILPRMKPCANVPPPTDLAEEASATWGREKALSLGLEKVLEILDDRPEDLLERLSDASAPLWPRPGDRDELIRCFGSDFARLAKENDLHHSLKAETIFVRVLGGIRSTELARA